TGNAVLDSNPVSGETVDLGLAPSTVLELGADERARVTPQSSGCYLLSLPVPCAEGDLIAVARVESVLGNPDLFPARAAREQAMLQGWLQAVGERTRVASQAARRHAENAQNGIAASWEALLVLDQVLRGLHIHKDAKKGLQRILEAASRLVAADTFLWIPQDQVQVVLHEGDIHLRPDECRQLATNLAQGPDFRASAPLLCNQVQTMAWG